MGVGFSLYLIALMYQFMSKDPIIKRTVKCRFCRKLISEKVGCWIRLSWSCLVLVLVVMADGEANQATRCENCTSWQDGREAGVVGPRD